MVQAKDCPKCAGVMVEGFVADQTHGAFALPFWVEGQAHKSVWTGLRLGGKARSAITTWRCRRCGFLENYALGEPDFAEQAKVKQQVRILIMIALLVGAAGLAVTLGIGMAG